MSIDFIQGLLPQTPEEVPVYLQELTQHLEEVFDQLHETGIWTPVLTDGTNNATMEAVNTQAVFTRIDDMVNVKGRIKITSLGSVTGDLFISGLPFPAVTGTGSNSTIYVGRGVLLAIVAGQHVSGVISAGGSRINLQLWDDPEGSTPMQATEFSADGDISFEGHYYTRPRL